MSTSFEWIWKGKRWPFTFLFSDLMVQKRRGQLKE